ncbi:MAG: ComEC/Rec2 family competence protein [Clostridia bacterium]
MDRFFNFRVFPILLFSVVVGIFVSLLLPWYISIILAVAMCIAIFILWKKTEFKGIGLLFTMLLFYLLATLSCYITIAQIESKKINVSDAYIEATISMDSNHNEWGVVDANDTIFIDKITIDGKSYSGKAKLQFFETEAVFKIGDKVTLRGRIENKKVNYFDGYSVTNFKRNYYYDVFVDEAQFFAGELSGIDKVKFSTKQLLYKNANSEVASFMYALIYGDTNGMDAQIKSDFAYIGTAHIFAVSGMHIGIIVIVLLLILRKLKVGNVINLIIISAVLLIYNIFCNFTPSVMRASIMSEILLISNCLGMKNDTISSFSLAGIILLLFSPLNLFYISFLMSFLAVLGMILFYTPINNKISKKIPKKIASLLSGSIAVNISLLPIMIYYFGKLSILFLLANVIVIPLISVLYPLLFVGLILAYIPHMWFLLRGIGYLFYGFVFINQAIAKVSAPSISFAVNGVFIFVYMVLMVVMSKFVFIDKKYKRLIAFSLLTVCIISMSISTANLMYPKTHMQVINNSDKYSHTIIMTDRNKNNYVIINGELSDFTMKRLKNIYFRDNLHKIDYFVKKEFSEEDLVLLEQYDELLIEKCVTETPMADEKFVDIIAEENITVGFVDNDILLNVEDVNILFASHAKPNADADILFCEGNIEKPENVDYLINNYGYSHNLAGSNKCNFTLTLKNGKMKFDFEV